jgi:eukaryotic-like serine/threonine-protein kinase
MPPMRIPVEFMMGSPNSEKGRLTNEVQHKRRIGRSFAVAAKLVTGEQYQRFAKNNYIDVRYAPEPDCPNIHMTWHGRQPIAIG